MKMANPFERNGKFDPSLYHAHINARAQQAKEQLASQYGPTRRDQPNQSKPENPSIDESKTTKALTNEKKTTEAAGGQREQNATKPKALSPHPSLSIRQRPDDSVSLSGVTQSDIDSTLNSPSKVAEPRSPPIPNIDVPKVTSEPPTPGPLIDRSLKDFKIPKRKLVESPPPKRRQSFKNSNAKSTASNTAVASPSLSAAAATNANADNVWGNRIGWLAGMSFDYGRNDKTTHELKLIKEIIHQCKLPRHQERLQELFHKIRDSLSEFRHYKVDAQIVRNSGLLTSESGLPFLFLGAPQSLPAFPFDIRADAKELAMKWRRQDFDPDFLRDIDFKNKHGSINKNRMKLRADYCSEGDLANGQWFPIWLCAVRDGAHGSAQAGIYGQKGQGAFSVVMAGAYDDIDDGDTVEYCGVAKPAAATVDANSTRLLFENVGRSDRPVRLLRGANINKKKDGPVNLYAPEVGLRYDGMYHVTSYATVSEERGEYRFFLRRVSGQDPIRYEGVTKRPSDLEVQNWRVHQQKLKGIGA